MKIDGIDVFCLGKLINLGIDSQWYIDKKFNIYSYEYNSKQRELSKLVWDTHIEGVSINIKSFPSASTASFFNIYKKITPLQLVIACVYNLIFCIDTGMTPYEIAEWKNALNYIVNHATHNQITQQPQQAKENKMGKPTFGHTGIENKMYLVGSQTGGILGISGNPAYHASDSEAQVVATDLAIKNPGKEFVVLKVIKTVVAGGITVK